MVRASLNFRQIEGREYVPESDFSYNVLLQNKVHVMIDSKRSSIFHFGDFESLSIEPNGAIRKSKTKLIESSFRGQKRNQWDVEFDSAYTYGMALNNGKPIWIRNHLFLDSTEGRELAKKPPSQSFDPNLANDFQKRFMSNEWIAKNASTIQNSFPELKSFAPRGKMSSFLRSSNACYGFSNSFWAEETLISESENRKWIVFSIGSAVLLLKQGVIVKKWLVKLPVIDSAVSNTGMSYLRLLAVKDPFEQERLSLPQSSSLIPGTCETYSATGRLIQTDDQVIWKKPLDQ